MEFYISPHGLEIASEIVTFIRFYVIDMWGYTDIIVFCFLYSIHQRKKMRCRIIVYVK